MMSPTSARIDLGRCDRCRCCDDFRLGHSSRRGFTLVEMLVVLGIIILLAGILVPAINRIAGKASRTSALADLAAIGSALDAYKGDFGDYPRVRIDPALTPLLPTSPVEYANPQPNPPTGAQILCAALYGPANEKDPTQPPDPLKRPRQDGADGLGFRVRPGGKLYPPYLPTDRFKIAVPEEQNNTNFATDLRMTIFDRYNRPVLYFPAAASRPNVRVTIPAGTPPYAHRSELSLYDIDDNLNAFIPYPPALFTINDGIKRLRLFLGDDNADGIINNAEQPYEQPYLLWSAGPDELHGPQLTMADDTGTLDARDAAVCDDITNFRVNNTR